MENLYEKLFGEAKVSKKSNVNSDMVEDDPNYCDPDVTFYHRVEAFFEDDPSFEVSDFDDDTYHFDIVVNDTLKYELLKSFLKVPKNCKRVSMSISCSESAPKVNSGDALSYLLNTNPLFSTYIKGKLMDYLLMKPEIVQYNNDVFNNPYRVETVTAEALAKYLFKGCGVNISSDAFIVKKD